MNVLDEQASRGIFAEAKTKKKKQEKKRGGGGRRGEGNNHWERNTLSTGAPTNCLAHEFMGRVSRLLDLDPALPPQGCWHLSSADDSSV